MKFIYIAFSTILILFQSNAQQTLEFHAAENAFQKEDYSKAIKLYTVIIETQKLNDLACSELQKAKGLRYAFFGNEADKNDVDTLLKKYCK